MKKDIQRILAVALPVLLAMSMAACSSAKKDGEGEGDEFPSADAGTDAAPADSPEGSGDAQALSQMQDPNAAPTADPAATPTGGEAPIAGSGQMEDYTVQSGDTLMKIAFDTYGDIFQWKRIYEANKDKISNPNSIPKGVVLKVERPATPVAIDRNGEKYLIKAGDTLGSISNQVYGTKSKWKQLYENNKQLIKDPNRIYAGFYLYYSTDGATPQAAPQETAPQPLSQAAPTDAGGAPPEQGAPATPPADGSAAVAGGTGMQIAPPSGDAGAQAQPEGEQRAPASDDAAAQFPDQ